MTTLLLLLACSPSPAPPAASGPSGADASGGPLPGAAGLPGGSGAAVAATARGVKSTPVACADPIYAPTDGWAAGDPVPADAHSATLGAAPTPYHAHPQWSGDPSTTVTFVWRTDVDTLASLVRFAPEGGDSVDLEGASFLLGDDPANGRVHEVRVCGLSPDTTYTWRVGGDGAWSEERLHTTAPVVGSTSRIRFGVAGDSRGGMTVLRAALAGQAARGAQFRVFTGDAVDRGEDIAEWNAWFDAGEGFLDAVPTVAANGNHEGLAQPFLALFAQPGNERNFSLDYGNVHLVVLNDTPTANDEWEEQAQWLEADLASTTQPWKLVFHHKPGWTAASHPPDPDVREHFVPVVEDGGVAVDFSGHNHNYERSYPLRDGLPTTSADGTTYVVTAGAGAPLYRNYADQPEMLVGIETYHYVMVDVYGSRLTVMAYDLAGNLIDSFSLER